MLWRYVINMGRDINKSMFDDATKLKLNIFGECFEEWFPVFLNSYWCKKLYIFDFFAGSGKDLDNNQGSPLVLLNRAKGASQKYCDKVKKEVSFLFNENRQEKSIELEQNVASHIKQCQQDNNCDCCVYQYRISSRNFQDIFSDTFIRDIFNNRNYAKFVLLDQYGFSQIDEQVFQKLVSFPRTDFIFFISSSFISRFREHPNTKKYIDTSKINFSELRPNEIHRGVANYFRDLISTKTEYYLHHFSIQKEVNRGNYYGLIFGTGHSLGMEKFLKVCWKEDPFSGEANYNIDAILRKNHCLECWEKM